MRRALMGIVVVAFGAAGLLAGGPRAEAAVHGSSVVDGSMRVQVLSPTLFRLEYAADGAFEDRPTLTATGRRRSRTPFSTRIKDHVRVITTDRAVLRYGVGSGPFSPRNLSLRLRADGFEKSIHPSFPGASVPPTGPPAPIPTPPSPDPDPTPATAGNLGGWYRALDGQSGPVQLHDGILSRDGWFLLDDTVSPLLTEGRRWYEPRPQRQGSYQDGYLFAYGHDYEAALRDFRSLAGPAPLLPRQAFGVWFSRYSFYSAQDYKKLIARFRQKEVPLDVLVVDTDFKSPNPWNGWGWTGVGFPDPPAFLSWAHSQGLAVVLNVHPSITEADPRFPAADAAAGGLPADSGNCNRLTGGSSCRVWDWARRQHVASYFSLHEPFELQGVDFWWLDWNRDESRADAPGLTPDAWINSLYAQRQRDRGSRWLPLSRIGSSMWHYGAAMPGAWAEHRNAIHFTGDTASTWEMLDFQSRFTAAEGAGIGLPYVSHDIGGFLGRELEPDLYVRWVQFGAFQPILRLHSEHGLRLPWDYPRAAERIASEFLRLRDSLVPYSYSAAREAFDTGLPMARPMYLEWPDRNDAYVFDRQYMFGDSLLVAPIASPGSVPRERLWFPPGEWVDVFTGKRHRGPTRKTLSTPLERMPVFARAGSIIPRQPYSPSLAAAPKDELMLDVYAGDDGSFQLYEDAGTGFEYREKAFTRTRLRWREDRVGAALTIEPARGGFGGRPPRRAYEIAVNGVGRPDRVLEQGKPDSNRLRSWDYDAAARLLTIRTRKLSTSARARIKLSFSRTSPRP